MNLKQLLSRQTIKNISGINARFLSSYPSCYGNVTGFVQTPNTNSPFPNKNPNSPKSFQFFNRFIHSGRETVFSGLGSNAEENEEEEEDVIMNEFLSRFVWIMRGKLNEVYTDCDKKTVDGMLLIIVGKVLSEMEKGGLEQMIGSAAATPSQDFSEDLWKTVWEVSNIVLVDMQKAKKKEKMKKFLQDEKVKEMVRFAGEAGIRGDLLRELRFKWAREEMEESEFYEEIEQLRTEEAEAEKEESETKSAETFEDDFAAGEEKATVVSLPKRSGKMKYKIYGLDLSDPKWAEVADKIHETGEWPQEPKPISGKCKIVTEKILSLQEDKDPSPLLAEWTELLQPSRVEWIAFLDRLKEQNTQLYFKVAELVLGKESFQTNIRDYSKLIDALAKQNRLEDAERILKKMNENGILPDILTFTTLVHMYSKARNPSRTEEAFKNLRRQGFQPDTKVYTSMILAYVNANNVKSAEALLREMETQDIKPTEEIYMALLHSFAQQGDYTGATRIRNSMDFAGCPQSQESCALLVEAYGRSGNPEDARKHFDDVIKLGHKPDDKCVASMLAAYAKKNLLDKGLNLLLQLEKDGVEPGVATYSVLVDWLARMELLDEAEEVLGKIAELGESPSIEVHLSLCDMYARAGVENKALQALGVLEAKKEQLKPKDFERIIMALIAGGFKEDARRVHGLMAAQGIEMDHVRVALMASQSFPVKRPRMREFF